MSTIEKHAFQAEIAQLLDIVIHSLYTDKEIFIRELISNAADATEKLRFLQTSGAEIFESDRPLTIAVGTDDSAHTISIADAGIGMTRDELIENLGTIAHSDKAFLQQIRENKLPNRSMTTRLSRPAFSKILKRCSSGWMHFLSRSSRSSPHSSNCICSPEVETR